MSKQNAKTNKKVVVKTTTKKGETTTRKTNEKLVLDDKFIQTVAQAVLVVLQEQTKQPTKIEPSKETKKTTQKKKSAKKPIINSTKTLVNKVYKAVKGSDSRQIKAIIGYLNKLRTKTKIKDYLTWLGKSKQVGRKCDLNVAKAILEYSKIEIK